MLPGKTETEVRYVTRSYLTRHGAGPLPTECQKETINADMADRTNVPNPHQQSLRYGLFDPEAVLARTGKDQEATRAVLPDTVFSAVITHLNETGGKLACDMDLDAFTAHFDRVYLSDNPYAARQKGRLSGRE